MLPYPILQFALLLAVLLVNCTLRLLSIYFILEIFEKVVNLSFPFVMLIFNLLLVPALMHILLKRSPRLHLNPFHQLALSPLPNLHKEPLLHLKFLKLAISLPLFNS